jgi:hypothetical protein
MGEAKRKARSPCKCGSGLAAASCCLTSRGWHKKPFLLDLSKSKVHGSHAGCYLRETGTCSSKLTGEHVVSEAVLHVLADEEVQVSGFAWLKGEKKILRFGNLTANCLCSNHNSALSGIDTIGGKFFAAVQQCAVTENKPDLSFLFSGHDIERWLFRTFTALAASNNLSVSGKAIGNKIHPEINFAAMLQNISRWQSPLGLYTMQPVGHTFTHDAIFQSGPIVLRNTNEIIGLMTSIQGLHVALLIAEHDIAGTGLERGFYRPGKIEFKFGRTVHHIQLSWEDDLSHETITLLWSR